MKKTAEFVSPKHPDKICDFIADSILDAYLEKDPDARTAIEVMGGHGVITISGEVSSLVNLDIETLIKSLDFLEKEELSIRINLSKQSPEIAKGVDSGGAGDQGIMIGYATNETISLMPREYELARNLCKKIYEKYPYDGKVQITTSILSDSGKRADSVIASFQNTSTEDLKDLIREEIEADEYIINSAGEWKIGGFDADSGLSGRKIVVDSYGPNIPVGGGSFSGKDATKVDRSGAYMARKIAVGYVNKGAKKALIKLAYAIGREEPIMAVAIIDGKEENIKGYDLSPQAIIERLELKRPIFKETSRWGHFGNGFIWDK